MKIPLSHGRYQSPGSRSSLEDVVTIEVEKTDGMFIIADGVSNANGGEAAKIATNIISDLCASRFLYNPEPIKDSKEAEIFIKQSFEEGHKALKTAVENHPKAEQDKPWATTLSMCIIRDNFLYIAHIGDSRIYGLKTDGNLECLTTDTLEPSTQTFDSEEFKNISSEKLNILKRLCGQKVVGIDSQLPPAPILKTIPLEEAGKLKYSKLVMMTDGVSDLLTEQDIRQILILPNNTPEDLANKIVKTALVDPSKLVKEVYEKYKTQFSLKNLEDIDNLSTVVLALDNPRVKLREVRVNEYSKSRNLARDIFSIPITGTKQQRFTLPEGKTFEDCKIEEFTYGLVLHAIDNNDGFPEAVVIKLFTKFDPDSSMRESIMREISTLRRIRYDPEAIKYIIKYMYDGTLLNHYPYLVMEDGEITLENFLRNKEDNNFLSIEEGIKVAIDLSNAIKSLSNLRLPIQKTATTPGTVIKIVHRDVKPDNVFVMSKNLEEKSFDKKYTIKLGDMNLVKWSAEEQERPSLQSSAIAITAMSYHPPEFKGLPINFSLLPEYLKKSLQPVYQKCTKGFHCYEKSDIYGVIACLYYSLTFKNPFSTVLENSMPVTDDIRDTTTRMLYAQHFLWEKIDINNDREKEAQFPPEQVEYLNKLFYRGLHPDPAQRFTAQELLNELNAWKKSEGLEITVNNLIEKLAVYGNEISAPEVLKINAQTTSSNTPDSDTSDSNNSIPTNSIIPSEHSPRQGSYAMILSNILNGVPVSWSEESLKYLRTMKEEETLSPEKIYDIITKDVNGAKVIQSSKEYISCLESIISELSETYKLIATIQKSESLKASAEAKTGKLSEVYETQIKGIRAVIAKYSDENDAVLSRLNRVTVNSNDATNSTDATFKDNPANNDLLESPEIPISISLTEMVKCAILLDVEKSIAYKFPKLEISSTDNKIPSDK